MTQKWEKEDASWSLVKASCMEFKIHPPFSKKMSCMCAGTQILDIFCTGNRLHPYQCGSEQTVVLCVCVYQLLNFENYLHHQEHICLNMFEYHLTFFQVFQQ